MSPASSQLWRNLARGVGGGGWRGVISVNGSLEMAANNGSISISLGQWLINMLMSQRK